MKAYLGLGSNVGDRKKNIFQAIKTLQSSASIISVSSLYEGTALEIGDQPDFLNAVISIESDLEPQALLALCKEIEKTIGRVERFRYGPREIDIDILLYSDMTVSSEELIIPHPKMLLRRFVLEPLLEIDPELKLPDGLGISSFLTEVGDQKLVRI